MSSSDSSRFVSGERSPSPDELDFSVPDAIPPVEVEDTASPAALNSLEPRYRVHVVVEIPAQSSFRAEDYEAVHSDVVERVIAETPGTGEDLLFEIEFRDGRHHVVGSLLSEEAELLSEAYGSTSLRCLSRTSLSSQKDAMPLPTSRMSPTHLSSLSRAQSGSGRQGHQITRTVTPRTE
jgi:hypothetical protein